MKNANKRTIIDELIMMMHDTDTADEVILDSMKAVPDVNAPESSKRSNGTLLMFAACYNRLNIAKYLIENGANVNAADKNGFTALHLAVQSNDAEIARLLLEHGADPNARDCFGNNPIIRSNLSTSYDLYDVLLAHGADPYQKNDYDVCMMDTLAADPDMLAYIKDRIR